MKANLKIAIAALIGGILGAALFVFGPEALKAAPAQLGTTAVIIDATNFGRQMTVNADGSINVQTATGDATAVSSVQASATAKGGSITLGGTSQTAIALNTSRKGFVVQNPCSATEQGIATAENLYLNFTSAATVSTNANVAVLPPCASFSMGLTAGLVTTEAITAIGATTAHIFYAKEF